LISDTSSDDEPFRQTFNNKRQYYEKEDAHSRFTPSPEKKRRHFKEEDTYSNFTSSPNKNCQFYQDDDSESTPHRSTVIVSPSTNTTDLSLNAASNSQDSGSSVDEDLDLDDIHAIHKKFIKPKKAEAPVIDQKAKNMMVVALKS